MIIHDILGYICRSTAVIYWGRFHLSWCSDPNGHRLQGNLGFRGGPHISQYHLHNQVYNKPCRIVNGVLILSQTNRPIPVFDGIPGKSWGFPKHPINWKGRWLIPKNHKKIPMVGFKTSNRTEGNPERADLKIMCLSENEGIDPKISQDSMNFKFTIRSFIEIGDLLWAHPSCSLSATTESHRWLRETSDEGH